MALYVVLKVIEGTSFRSYTPQVATVGDYSSKEDAACFNVGTYPDYDKRGRPYKTVVVPFEHWHEFDVFGESSKGRRSFVAYQSEEPTMRHGGDT